MNQILLILFLVSHFRITLLLKIWTITICKKISTKVNQEMTIPMRIQLSKLWNEGYSIKLIRQFKKVLAKETWIDLLLMMKITTIEQIQLWMIIPIHLLALNIPQIRTLKRIIVTQNRILFQKVGFLLMKVEFSLKIKMILG